MKWSINIWGIKISWCWWCTLWPWTQRWVWFHVVLITLLACQVESKRKRIMMSLLIIWNYQPLLWCWGILLCWQQSKKLFTFSPFFHFFQLSKPFLKKSYGRVHHGWIIILPTHLELVSKLKFQSLENLRQWSEEERNYILVGLACCVLEVIYNTRKWVYWKIIIFCYWALFF